MHLRKDMTFALEFQDGWIKTIITIVSSPDDVHQNLQLTVQPCPKFRIDVMVVLTKDRWLRHDAYSSLPFPHAPMRYSSVFVGSVIS